MYGTMELMNLNRDLLCTMGLGVDNNQTIFDQDSRIPLKFQDKSIKISMDPNKPVYITNCDIKFDPINKSNIRLMTTLFGLFLDKEQECGDISQVLSFYTEDINSSAPGTENPEIKTRLIVKCINEMYVTNYYTNKCLMYCDAILRIGGNFGINSDMTRFDIDIS